MEHPKLTWSGTVPIAVRFDDPYYAKTDGLAETLHTYLSGNDLPARLEDGFCIAELGFGTGLNAAATLAAWQALKPKGKMHFVSFEAYPMSPTDMAKALAPFEDIADQAATLLAFARSKKPTKTIDGFTLEIIKGDARLTVPHWPGSADAWYLDGFSPAKNPELWDADLLKSVGEKTNPNGTFATYTSAGHVRRNLEAAGFAVSRTKGFGTKRHMSIGRKSGA